MIGCSINNDLANQREEGEGEAEKYKLARKIANMKYSGIFVRNSAVESGLTGATLEIRFPRKSDFSSENLTLTFTKSQMKKLKSYFQFTY